MKDPFQFADGFGPSRIVSHSSTFHRFEGHCWSSTIPRAELQSAASAWRSDVSVEECFRLARAMTWKNAAAGLPHGGGKSVIFGDPRMPIARQGRNHPRICQCDPRHFRLRSRSRHGNRRTLHGLDQGRDRARGRPSQRCRRNSARRNRSDRVRTCRLRRGGVELHRSGAKGRACGGAGLWRRGKACSTVSCGEGRNPGRQRATRAAR